MGAHRARRWMRALAATAAACIALGAAAVPATAADDDEGSGLGISVTVISPVGGGGAGPTSTTRPGTRQVTPGASASAVNTSAGAPEPAAADVEVAGGLFLSDIEGSTRPTANPFEGGSELWFTLRNSSTDTLDLTADFSLATLYGARIDGELVQVTAVKPGETRVVGVTLAGGGQWPFVVGRVTIDPPDTISGHATAPVARAGLIWVFPWMVLIAAVLVALSVILLRVRPAFLRSVPVGAVPA